MLDELEPLISKGGVILDWHTCEIFPERWPDLVIVLRCDHSKLWERLESRFVCFQIFLLPVPETSNRGYPLKKIQENNEAEIMQVVLEEARASYPQEIVIELQSESVEDLGSNVARIVEWIRSWIEEHST